MRYPYLKSFGLSLIYYICIALSPSYAQENNRPVVTNTIFLRRNGEALLSRSQSDRQAAYALAATKRWETGSVNRDGAVSRLQKLDDAGLPLYYITTNNTIAAGTTRTNKLYSGGSLGLSLSGSTIPAGRIAIWDSDAVLASHSEFSGNRIEVRDNTTETAIHSTHVAGTMIAAGINPVAKGMAFGLPRLYSFNFDNDTPEMSANAANLLISNHSYGTIAGWYLNTGVTPQRWEFYGLPDKNEDYKFGYYDSESAEWDKICYNAPYYLPVKSAGNNRSVNGPAVGSTYFRYNTNREMANAGNRPPGISDNDGYDNIATYGTAKNILTVGAVNPLANGPYTPESIRITSFSSWGPTDDGRIKPDLVADGVRVTSTSNTGNTAYTTLSGTSMATPNVSGSLILLQELYRQQNPNYMRSATLKALAIGTATEAGTADGPDYSYGWGLLNAEAAAKVILNNGQKSKIIENVLLPSEQFMVRVVASGDEPLTGTICWTDPEAIAVSSLVALNNKVPRLVNDLDLRAEQGTAIYSPWILDPAHPEAAATKGDNTRDNVEQVTISSPVAGAVYNFSVSHKGTLARGSQPYSIVLSGISGNPEQVTTSSQRNEGINFRLYPVPAKDDINVSFTVSETENVQLSLINILGQELYSEKKNDFSGVYTSHIDLSAYAGGFYFIRIKVGSTILTKKFVCTK